jgi:uncharacterized protein (DUF58 family)
MTIPTNRLLLVAAVSVVPGLTWASVGISSSPVGLLLAALGGFLALLDAYWSFDPLRPLRLDTPRLVHAIVGRSFDLELTVHSTSRRPLVLQLTFPEQPCLIPLDFVRAKLTTQDTRLLCPFRALERGRFELTRVELETVSRLGLWFVRRDQALATRIRAYPDLRQERRELARAAASSELGSHPSASAGRGRSFERLRDYVPGDDLGDVHWKATAKRRKLTTKLFQLERAQRIYVAVDSSRLSARPCPRHSLTEEQPLPLLERYVNAALVLGSVARLQGDHFGFVAFSDGVDQFAPAGSGAAHFRACREAALAVRQRRVNADYRELFTFLSTKVRRRSLVVVLTSIEDPALTEELVDGATRVARRHVVVVAAVEPLAVCSLGKARPVRRASEIGERLAGHLAHKRVQTTAHQLSRRGVRFLSLDRGDMLGKLVSSYRRLREGYLT